MKWMNNLLARSLAVISVLVSVLPVSESDGNLTVIDINETVSWNISSEYIIDSEHVIFKGTIRGATSLTLTGSSVLEIHPTATWWIHSNSSAGVLEISKIELRDSSRIALAADKDYRYAQITSDRVDVGIGCTVSADGTGYSGSTRCNYVLTETSSAGSPAWADGVKFEPKFEPKAVTY
jgi:hypothetical protein